MDILGILNPEPPENFCGSETLEQTLLIQIRSMEFCHREVYTVISHVADPNKNNSDPNPQCCGSGSVESVIISLDPDPYKKMAGSGIQIRIK